MSSEQAVKTAYEQAVAYLAARMLTVGEIQDKLRKKKFSPTVIIEVVRSLEDADFLNDERYASIFVENLKRYKDFGYFGIKLKLLKKKVPTDIIDNVLEEFFTPEDEYAVAEDFVKKLRRRGRTTYEQLARSLTSKGFRTDIVAQILHDEAEGEKD